MIDPASLLGKQEELDPELQGYLETLDTFGNSIRHPLVYSIMHFPQMNAWVNQQLRAKREALQRAERDCDWHSYIWLHERPYRIEAFQEIEDNLTDEQYWYLLGKAWIDSENIRQNPDVWFDLLQADRDSRPAIMVEGERSDLRDMPAVIPVYQGHTVSRDDGMSWTIDLATAEWFAHRFAWLESDRPALSIGTVKRADVLAYFTGRNESEIVVDRDLVDISSVDALRPKTSMESDQDGNEAGNDD